MQKVEGEGLGAGGRLLSLSHLFLIDNEQRRLGLNWPVYGSVVHKQVNTFCGMDPPTTSIYM